MNLSGAEKITKYLGEILMEETDLKDRRGEEALVARWKEKDKRYEADREKQYEALGNESIDAETEDNDEEPVMATELAKDNEDIEEDLGYKGYAFIYHDVVIEIDADVASILEELGEANSYFEAASCAFNGLDKMYTYSSFELDTYPVDDKDYVSMVLFKDDSIATAEGVSIGDPAEKVTEIYGEDAAKENGMLVYQKDGMKLCFIVENGSISSIEYQTTVLDE